MEKEALSREIVEVCRWLHSERLLAASDGNVSCRAPDGRILITPSGRHKAFVDAAEIAALDADGTPLSGNPSSERFMHVAIYRRCPSARWVVHAHPVAAVAWTLARPHQRSLPSECLPELLLSEGRVPIVPYARPGTRALGDSLSPFLPEHRVLILARHGAVSWGETPHDACGSMERVEHASRILLLASATGRPATLPDGEVEALRALREKRTNLTRG